MPGRVKHRPSTKSTISFSQRRVHARMVDPAQTSSAFHLDTAGTKGLVLNKQTIAWMVVVAVMVLITLIVVSILLCRCTCRKRRKRRRHSNGELHRLSYEVTDGRNEFTAWNRNARPRFELDQNGFSFTPLAPAAVKSAGDVHPGEPVIVDEGPQTPVYARSRGSRYYSGMSNAWKRVSRLSQIGKAY